MQQRSLWHVLAHSTSVLVCPSGGGLIASLLGMAAPPLAFGSTHQAEEEEGQKGQTEVRERGNVVLLVLVRTMAKLAHAEAGNAFLCGPTSSAIFRASYQSSTRASSVEPASAPPPLPQDVP